MACSLKPIATYVSWSLTLASLTACTSLLGDFAGGNGGPEDGGVVADTGPASDATISDATGRADAATDSARVPDAPNTPDASAGDSSPDAGIDASTDALFDAVPDASADAPRRDATLGSDAGDATSSDASDAGSEDASDATSCGLTCALGFAQCGTGTVETCITLDSGCPGFAVTATCGVHQQCVAGLTLPACTCLGLGVCGAGPEGNECNSSNTYVTCAKDDAGCFYEANLTTCSAPDVCATIDGGASCSRTCTDQCSVGETTCSGATALSSCQLGALGCDVWADGGTCPAYMACGGGTYDAGCVCAPNLCNKAGASVSSDVCTDGGAYTSCYTDPTSGCLIPKPGGDQACPSGSACLPGDEITACTCENGGSFCGTGVNEACCASPLACNGGSCGCPAAEQLCGTAGSPLCCEAPLVCNGTSCGCPLTEETACAVGAGYACCGAGSVCTASGCSLPTGTSGVSDAGMETLALWLTADRNLLCDGGTVTGWQDMSGQGHNAFPSSSGLKLDGGVIGAHLGPACTVSGHTLNGVPLPFFNAPDAASPWVDGTLDLDLSFLSGKPFTAFVVERRAGPMPASDSAEELLGTTIPPTDASIDTGIPGGGLDDSTLALGYSPEGNCTDLQLDFAWVGNLAGASAASTSGASPTSIDTFETSGAYGAQYIWVNGVGLTSHISGQQIQCPTCPIELNPGFITYQKLGSIGRAWTDGVYDRRYFGDIAEILVFTSALADADRQAVENYLTTHWGGATVFPPITNNGGPACDAGH